MLETTRTGAGRTGQSGVDERRGGVEEEEEKEIGEGQLEG